MDVRKIATRNAKPDRFGAGGEEQRAEALPAAVREPDFSGLGIDRDRAGAGASARSRAVHQMGKLAGSNAPDRLAPQPR